MTSTSIILPRLGALWPGQGGIFVGSVRGDHGAPDFHLIVPIHPAAFIKGLAWGSYGEDEPGAQHERDGLANTIALVQSTHDHPAAEQVAGLEIEDHQDFYLPSRQELRLCAVNVPELFEPGWYWSSTQYSRYDAWDQFFGDGDQYNLDKGYPALVRAVRRFTP